jgi:hypothetical protein
MREPLPYGFEDVVAAQVERLVHAARIERARTVRSAFAAAFRWLRGLSSTWPKQRTVPGAARC